MSSRKNVILPKLILSAGDMSASITSSATNINFLDNASIQLNFTGAPVGTFAVQGSLDYSPGINNDPLANAGNWVDLPLSVTPTASGSPDVILMDLSMLPFPWIRVVYTRTSGTGSLNYYIVAKEI